MNLPLEDQQFCWRPSTPGSAQDCLYHLTNEVQRLQIKGEVQAEVTKKVGKTQKEYILREQMKHIQEELGRKTLECDLNI